MRMSETPRQLLDMATALECWPAWAYQALEKQTQRTLLWTCIWRSTGVLNIWNPFIIWHKGQCDKSAWAPMHLSICGTTPNECCRLEFDFGWHFWDPYLPRWNQYQWLRGYFCASTWGKCPLLLALVSRPDTTLGVGKGIAQGLEGGAGCNYPTSATSHAQRLLPCCSDTRLLFFFPFFLLFFRWNLWRELQNTKQLWLWLPLWVPFPPPVVTGSRGKAKVVRSLQKKRN